MVAATAEAGTGLFCTWAQGCAPTPYPLPPVRGPYRCPGPQDYPCLPLGWAALAQATHLLLLRRRRRTPRGPARCTGASWETLSAQGARYGGGEKGQRWACSWASRDPGPRSLGRHAKRPQRAGRSGARPSRILRSASSAQAAFRFPHQPRRVQESLTWVGGRSRLGARGYRRAPRRGAGCSAPPLRRQPAAPRPRSRPSARGGSSPGHRARPLRRGCCHTKSRKWLWRGAPSAPLFCNLLLPRTAMDSYLPALEYSASRLWRWRRRDAFSAAASIIRDTCHPRRREASASFASLQSQIIFKSLFLHHIFIDYLFCSKHLSRAKYALAYNRAPYPLGAYYLLPLTDLAEVQ